MVVVATGWSGRDLVYRSGAVRTHHYPDRYVMADVVASGVRSRACTSSATGGRVVPAAGRSARLVAWAGTGEVTDADGFLRDAVAARTGVEAEIAGASTFGVRRAVAPALRRGRIVVVGDAAHEVSPIGGQGMNLGLLDALTVAPLLAPWVRHGDDTGLARWERDRLASARHAARLAS